MVTNTVANPEAVVVKVVHAAVALSTVFGANGLHQSTRVAHEEDGVVQVSVLTPCRGVAHLQHSGVRRGGVA